MAEATDLGEEPAGVLGIMSCDRFLPLSGNQLVRAIDKAGAMNEPATHRIILVPQSVQFLVIRVRLDLPVNLPDLVNGLVVPVLGNLADPLRSFNVSSCARLQAAICFASLSVKVATVPP